MENKTYDIQYYAQGCGSIEIEASTEEEAQEKFYCMASDGEFNCGGWYVIESDSMVEE